MNTSSRIEGLCGKLKEPLLISDVLMQKQLAYLQAQFISKGMFKLKGKEKEVGVFGFIEKGKIFLEPEVKDY